ncbi:cobalt ECF transporter T component CbiQ [Vagococcus carniphilus]|uniref:Cobalt ECF transporter T component CbiQ n=1 Tax=Vagococcus carniphilus TaxID=218144 RepID=A0AAW8U5F2_9ENTE|nr:cobalt ECF transporter T component CbiQ [Vagococcus carniphilus]MDT2830531.1 cobalt ECF transporter T component CbiQ [Vagococcus carniphilus]MDT2832577.1 cobalt ECF transporter T component CbiQ [Vagococcus carniphilus]MDT2839829.1 cobalt ECF transporter T component CbiQ [Vagococcus carniphilus]MDT2849782.1 cobalt ECF transporter T component CbiQ [Vagococcus carniphilus]MDT2854724.1 cobalt ECF transporter T component CbiQ [Vagococcus carniphilus]
MLLIDKIAYESKLRDVSPVAKSICYLLLLVYMFALPPIFQMIGIIVIGIATIYTAQISVRRYLKWLLVPLPFLLVSFITIILTISNSKSELIFSAHLFGRYIGANEASLMMGYKLFFRSFGCLACTYFYSMSVPFNQILLVLRKCHLPSYLIEITMLMYRFIFILLDEMLLIHQSQNIRFGYQTLRTSYQSLGLLFRVLFVQSMARYNQMMIALEMKFFNGDFPLD